MVKHRKWKSYSLLKATEGGMAKAFVKAMCKSIGIPVRDDYTPYIGHYGLQVPSVKAKKFERCVLGWK